MEQLSKDQIAQLKHLAKLEACRKHYQTYVEHVHRGLWYAGRHLRYICRDVEALLDGTLRNDVGNEVKILLLSLPPQHGKSQCISETLPSWYLGNNPNKRVIIVSYNTEFATRFGRRNIAKIKEFGNEIFHINLTKETSDNFEVGGGGGDTTPTGACICRGIMSGITGNPADLIICDDPIKNREEAESETYRAKLWDEYLNSVKTRLSANGKIIVIQTRWHENDLIGQILENEGYKAKYINFPCEAEENDILGRKPGDALFPEIGKDNLWLQDFKLSYMTQEGSRAWQALFQGHPATLEGNLLKREWWRYYDTLPQPLDRICQSWDCTFKDSATSDYVVGQVWGMKGLDCYLIDQVRSRMDFPTTINAIEAMKAKYPNTQRIFVEDKANGSAIVSILQNKISGIIPVNPEGGKVSRVNAISAHIESGHVYLPKFASFLNDFITECSMFPNGAHDDCCFMAGTKVATLFGDKNIEDIKVGDKIITPFCIRKVICSECTGLKPVINFNKTWVTPDHPYFTFENGFTRVDSLTQSLNTDKISLGGLLQWRYQKLLYLMKSNIDLWGREGIILVNQSQMKEEKKLKDFMWQFGNFITKRQYQQGIVFTIRMGIATITTLATWTVYQLSNIVRCLKKSIWKNSISILKKLDHLQNNGMEVKKDLTGIKTIIPKVLVRLNLKNSIVNFVEKNLKPHSINRDFVPIIVQISGDTNIMEIQSKRTVSSVESNLNVCHDQKETMDEVHVVQSAGEYSTGRIEKVYNITVEKDHVYYANGLLVSNCDAMSQAINRMMYYRNIDKPIIDYRQGGHYHKKELLAKGFKEYEILRLAKQGKIKLIGK